MKSFHTTIFLIFIFLSTTANAQLNVITTLPDLASITRAIGGERVVVKSIARGDQDPHSLQAKPSFMRDLNRADLLVYNGLELEVGWLPLLIQGARNPRITPGSLGHLDASIGIPLLEVPTGQIDRSMGDVHTQGNPHYLLDPRNGLIVAQTITRKLQELDAAHASTYQKNLDHFQTDLKAHIKTWEIQLASLQGKPVVTDHKLWEYLANWLQITIVDQIENKPGIPPSPHHVATLINRMKTDHIHLLFVANYTDPKPAQRVAEQVNAKLLILPASVDSEKTIASYTSLFQTIVSQLSTVTTGS